MKQLTFTLALVLALPSVGSATTFYVTIAGLGGEPGYEEQFADLAARLDQAGLEATGSADAVITLTGEAATKDRIVATFVELAERVDEADHLVVTLIGHGSYDSEHYKFNVPGPDITGDELAELFGTVAAKRQLIINTTSSSGAVGEMWQADDRIVITATKSGFERNATRFGRFFTQAFDIEDADTNKNGTISAQEAFDYAARRVADSYERDGALATEHPRIFGELANAFVVARPGASAAVAATPYLNELMAEREAIELDIERLKIRKEGMANDDYLQQLQNLMVKLALVQQQIDAEQVDDEPGL